MMDSKRRKLFRIISLLIILVNVSCNEKIADKPKEGKRLECLLDIFINEESMKNEHYIYVTEMQNWTDTTSVIALQYSDNPLSEEVDSLQANIGVYKNHKVIYSVGSFEKTPKKSRMISNNIKWNNFSYDKNKSNSDNNSLKYSEYELQFVYDFVNDTIIRVLKSYPSKELNILEKIKKCQF